MSSGDHSHVISLFLLAMGGAVFSALAYYLIKSYMRNRRERRLRIAREAAAGRQGETATAIDQDKNESDTIV